MTAASQLMHHEVTNRRHSFGVLSTTSNTVSDASMLTRTGSMQLGTSSSAGGPMRRVRSKNSLFNEDVIEVSILKSPARKPNVRAPLKLGVPGASDGVHETIVSQQIGQVTVLDALLGMYLVVNVDRTYTVGYLKSRIQSRQGQEGLRIIPAHVQLLTFKGIECRDDDLVWSLIGGVHLEAPVFVVEPRVNELVSFFLASVSNLAGSARSPKTDRQLSPTTSCADAAFAQPVSQMSLDNDGTLFFGGEGMEMDDVEEEGITETPSLPSSPRSIASPADPLSPVMPMSFGSPVAPLFGAEDRKQRLALYRELHLEVAMSPDALSSKTTPVSDLSFTTEENALACSFTGACAFSFDGISCLGQVLQLDRLPGNRQEMQMTASASLAAKGGQGKGAGLDAVLLRQVDKGNYSSQSHIIFRDRDSCLKQLAAPKLKAMEQIVLEVQSGLRHGHVPEELSTSNRDSISSHLSLADSSWEQERASWWKQHMLSHQGQGQGHVTDFDYGELVQNCCGGTYMMRNSAGAHSAVFKPMDEEPYAPLNPKGFTGAMDVKSEMKAGVAVGGGAVRECAAFLLDHDGLGCVPCTAMLRIVHTTLLPDNEAEVQIKVGSLQRFQQHDCTAEDVGTARFDATQTHAIGVLDVRCFNMDRNSDNVLVRMSSTNSASMQLVPIDHGYILPSYKHLEDVHVCWLHWPQAKAPYTDKMLKYIEKLDAEADMELLRSTLALPEESLLTLFIGTTLIKAAAANGLTLHETGMLMIRERPDCPSAIEHVVAEAEFLSEADALDGGMCDGFYESMKLHLKELLVQVVLARHMD